MVGQFYIGLVRGQVVGPYEIRNLEGLLLTLNSCNFTDTEPILKIKYALERGDPNSLISGVFYF